MQYSVLNDPAYARSNPSVVNEALRKLGCNPSSNFRVFYERYAGPFTSEYWGFSLLDIIDQVTNIVTQTEECRKHLGFPAKCLAISDIVGNAILVYDCITDAVFNVDFEGGDKKLIAGTLAPSWRSFSEFLVSYFQGSETSET